VIGEHRRILRAWRERYWLRLRFELRALVR
jgi:hypothetical protein